MLALVEPLFVVTVAPCPPLIHCHHDTKMREEVDDCMLRYALIAS